MLTKESSSFRDPAGQVYIYNGEIVRCVHPSYNQHYEALINSGLCQTLTDNYLLIPHESCREETFGNAYYTLYPEKVKFISYPYEWCFSYLKQAALNTLTIADIALDYGMMLKDASAYNIQWHKGNMVLIDTLSFIKYENGMPWNGYSQFLRHFLYPLLLMAYCDSSMSKLLAANIDGITSHLTAKLLPNRLRLQPSVLMHVYAHNTKLKPSWQVRYTKQIDKNTIRNLRDIINGLQYKVRSDWSGYTDGDSYTTRAHDCKVSIIKHFLRTIESKSTLADFGCNTGEYTLFAYPDKHVMGFDADHDCVEDLNRPIDMFPAFVVDLCNPSPAIGWQNTERKSFLDRLQVDTIMALALIHHLCVANNVPLSKVAEMLAGHCKHLIIEFVPPEDPKTKLLLANKTIPPYSLEIFKTEFSRYFTIEREEPITDSLRTLYLMEKR